MMWVMTDRVVERWRRGRPWRTARLGYVIVAVGLIVADMVYNDNVEGSWISKIIWCFGAVTFAVGVWVNRPYPRPAWLLTCMAFLFLAGSGVSANLAQLFGSPPPVWLVGLGGIGLLCLAGGLTEFSRRIARSGPKDAIDATMTALATFLLLWTLVIAPLLQYNPRSAFSAILWPIGVLLVLAAASRLTLAGGWRVPAVAVLLVVSFAVMFRTNGSGRGGPPTRIAFCQMVLVASVCGCVKSIVRV